MQEFCNLRFLKEPQLNGARPSKSLSGEGRSPGIESGFPASQLKQLGDMLGVRAAALHSRTEVRIVQPAAANVANAIQDFFFLERAMKRQPFFKQRGYTVWQAQRDVTCGDGAHFCDSRDDCGHFVIRQPGDYRRDQRTNGNARLRQ